MRRITVFLTLLTALVATGCSGGSYSILMGHLDSTSHDISGSYAMFSGHYFRKTRFAAGEDVEFRFTSHTDKGRIQAELINSSGSIVSALSRDETVRIPKSGIYRVQVNADHHKGDFDLTWHEVESK